MQLQEVQVHGGEETEICIPSQQDFEIGNIAFRQNHPPDDHILLHFHRHGEKILLIQVVRENHNRRILSHELDLCLSQEVVNDPCLC